MTAEQIRNAVVASYLTRKGKNSYTQGVDRQYFYGKPTDGKPGFSDCSSSWRAAYLRICGIDIGGNTAAQIVNKKLAEVCLHTKGQPDWGKLELGDLLLFKGSDPSRPFGVGHVEGYIGNGQIAGHGSGTGPRVTNGKNYCSDRYSKGRGLIKVLRVIADDSSDDKPSTITPTYPLGFGARNLKYGHSGDDVANLQRALIALGFSCGKWGADGDFGTSTKNAAVAYQHSKKLTQDGVVGPTTRAAMEKDLPEQGDSDEDKPEASARRVEVFGGDYYIRETPVTGRILGVGRNGQSYPWSGKISAEGWNGVVLDGEDAWITGKNSKVV